MNNMPPRQTTSAGADSYYQHRRDETMQQTRKKQWGLVLMGAISIGASTAMMLQNPIAQDPGYHNFSDTQTLLGVPNFWNVISNLPFLLVGFLGLYQVATGRLQIDYGNRPAYVLLFLGAALVSLGSGYYHLMPHNASLVWDRLPMTIAFMALFSIIIGEFIAPRVGKLLLLPLLCSGIASVLYWHLGETRGSGDLRFYALVQFLPMLLIPVILLCFGTSRAETGGYWLLLAAYIAAKLFEHFDSQLHDLFGFISGHSIKHAVAALGLYLLLRSYRRRAPTQSATNAEGPHPSMISRA
jgi:hypothetical protein